MKRKKEYQKEIINLIKEIERIDALLTYSQIDNDFKSFITTKKEEIEQKIKDLQNKYMNTR